MYVQCNNNIIICFQAGWAQFVQRWANWPAPNSLVFIAQLIENCSATAEEKDFQQILILLWLNLYFPCISCYLRKLIRVGRLFDFTAYEVGAYLGESAYYSVDAYSRKYAMHYGEEKTLRRVAMVAKFLDEKKAKRHLKSGFALFQTSSIPSNFI